jgi:hypothetical protein
VQTTQPQTSVSQSNLGNRDQQQQKTQHVDLDPGFRFIPHVKSSNGETAIVATPQATVYTLTPPAPGQHWPEQGGIYIGIAAAETDADTGITLPMRHVIALDAADPEPCLPWAKAITWAASLGNGARLPTRIEAIMAYNVAAAAFNQDDWYWTGTQHSRISAFVQGFEDGNSHWDD